LSSSD
jgi:hypothetical protein